MAFSNVVIEFTNDWVNGDTLIFSASSQVQSFVFTWVTTRSTTYEVTSGTPTATAGETAAINFKAAFDLDFTSGYTTSISSNEVTITSTTAGEQFYIIEAGFSNTGTLTSTINNGTILSTDIDLGLIRSPHYIYTPFVYDTTTKIDLSLYVWSGDITSLPTSTTYELTKVRPTVDFSEFNTDVAKILRDSVTITPDFSAASGVTSVIGSNSGLVNWVNWIASFTDTTETINDIENYVAVTDGYGYYSEGINPTYPVSCVLSDCDKRQINRTHLLIIPFINNGTITSIDIDTDGTDINETETVTTSNLSTNYVQYLVVDLSATTDNYLTVDFGTDTYTFEIIDECRYDTLPVYFVNKYGAIESLTLNKKRSDTISIEKNDFVNNYVSGGTFDITQHQKQKINVIGRETFTVNSGYILEDENELYKQLMLSEKVWIYENNGYVPVNITNSNLEFKTRVNDKLINYTIEFEYAFNTIQNV